MLVFENEELCEEEVARAELYKLILETMDAVEGENTRDRLISYASDKLGLELDYVKEIIQDEEKYIS
ncbi:MAG: hypothetical protein SPLUMA2_SPLUMAMAG2_01492 [uncultured Sulfurimonas sp.]|nr:MAG: hypothetical protein SPLUMA2_SPLUMAMAG2_01492 [uncultured Sulfurimonas sp.]